jgi:hypothetical protein
MRFWQKTIQYIKKYENHLSTGAMVVGFIIDNLTTGRIDQVFSHVFIIFYVLTSGLSILLINFVEVKNINTNLAQKIKIFAPIVMQFAYGGLFSAFFVFYSRSGSFWSSWPFLVLMLGLLILNEFLKEKYSRLVYQMGVYFFIVFSYMIFLVPVILKQIGQLIFIYSGLVSLILIYFFTIVLHVITRKKYFLFHKKMWLVIFGIYFIMNIFYFTNILPPLPLSMKDSGVYNLIEKSNNNYLVYRKHIDWFDKYFKNTIEIKPDSNLYYFSSVFAPTKLNTQIIHEWEYYDQLKGKWIKAAKISFSISGGRDEGYRGYSLKQNLKEGDWKVLTKTVNGQIIGEEKFKVVFTDENLNLEKISK